MEEEIELYIDDAKEHMEKAIIHLTHELSRIRAGKASPAMLEGIKVEYYGTPTALNQVASITSPDARTLMVKPWEKNIIGEIEKAILHSDLGLNPQNDGEQVFINVPMLTQERREALMKQSRGEGEQGKISIRNIRKDANDHLKQLMKDGFSEDSIKNAEAKVQELTDRFVHKVDEMMKKKEEEIMTV